MATNFELHECVIFVKSTKMGTHVNKAVHSNTTPCSQPYLNIMSFMKGQLTRQQHIQCFTNPLLGLQAGIQYNNFINIHVALSDTQRMRLGVWDIHVLRERKEQVPTGTVTWLVQVWTSSSRQCIVFGTYLTKHILISTPLVRFRVSRFYQNFTWIMWIVSAYYNIYLSLDVSTHGGYYEKVYFAKEKSEAGIASSQLVLPSRAKPVVLESIWKFYKVVYTDIIQSWKYVIEW